MDESWQKLYDDLKDPNVSKEDKDKIWTFIQNESQRFMEFAYPSIISDEDRKQIREMKEKLLKLDVGNGDGYLKDFLGDPEHNAKILAGEYKKGEARL